MDALIGIITGFFIGSIFSMVALSFCIAAKRGDEYIGIDRPYDDSKETKNDDDEKSIKDGDK